MRVLAANREETIRRVIAREVPELRYVQEHNRAELESALPYDSSEDDVVEAVGGIHLRNQRTGRELVSSLVKDLQSATTLNLTDFARDFGERVEKITRPSQATLASYVVYRRSIIDIYREILKKSGNKFQREAAVHKLLFPMNVEHDASKAYTENNLWLLDERLTFAQFIDSDRPLSEHAALFGVESGDKPDVACYFNFGFSENDPTEGALHNVVLVELKRPGPIQSRDETPWEQVLRYIEKMREGSWSESGQKIKASDNTRFYCFIVCDLDDTKVINDLRVRWEFKPVFDSEDGYMRYFSELKAYVEVIPLEKVLRDAERKHRAFFERLGLLKL